MSTHNLHNSLDHSESTHLHRIGSVSRLSGVPVSTLRMWESRYQAFSPGKSEGRHRLYDEADVLRAGILRKLTDAGHSIGRIASAPLEQLQRMLADAQAAAPRGASRSASSRLRAVIVGGPLAARVNSPGWSQRLGGVVLDVASVFMTLVEADTEAGLSSIGSADILLVRVNALQASTVERLIAVKQRSAVRNAVLLYNFGTQAAADALRAAGFLLRREPIDHEELADLLKSATWASAAPDTVVDMPTAALPSRRFSESTLAQIAASPPNMLCECPRHLVEIITQLSSFEEYSAQCLNDSEEDARIHAQLRSVAGSARALFEDALELVLAHERAKEDR